MPKRLTKRYAEFLEMPPEKREASLKSLAPRLCESTTAKKLFGKFCKGDINKEGAKRLFRHMAECKLCRENIIRFMWTATAPEK